MEIPEKDVDPHLPLQHAPRLHAHLQQALRSELQKTFHSLWNNIQVFVDKLEKYAEANEVVNIYSDICACALDIIAGGSDIFWTFYTAVLVLS
jgi:hypothetical protein